VEGIGTQVVKTEEFPEKTGVAEAKPVKAASKIKARKCMKMAKVETERDHTKVRVSGMDVSIVSNF
jgi:hypothetical protein